MAIKNNKKRFLCYELGLLSLKAAISTRDGEAPVYAKGIKYHQRKKEKQVLRGVFEELEKRYLASNVTEDEHCKFIQMTADNVSRVLGTRLHNRRFRIGVAQKLINLHLKYLWVISYIAEPPLCPID